MSNTNEIFVDLLQRTHSKYDWDNIYFGDVLKKGQMGVEGDTNKFKIGDGITTWENLTYYITPILKKTAAPINNVDNNYDLGQMWLKTEASKGLYYLESGNKTTTSIWKKVITPDDLSGLGYGDMLKSEFATDPDDGTTAPNANAKWVDKAKQARDVLGDGKLGTTTGDTSTTDRQPDNIFEPNSNTVKRATKATKDGDDNTISTTYIKITDISSTVAPIVDGTIPSQYIPGQMDEVLDCYIVGDTPFAVDWLSKQVSGTPITPQSSKLYIILTEGDYVRRIYRWSGSTYVEVSASLALGEVVGTAYEGSKGKANADAIAALANNTPDNAVNIMKLFLSEEDTLILNGNPQ